MKYQQGQTLVEVIIALALAGIILSTVSLSVINSLKNSQDAKNQTTATQYMQQGMEIVRNMRQADYNTFTSLSGTYCFADSCTALSTTDKDPCGPSSSQCLTPNISPLFIRQVIVQKNASSCNGSTQVRVIVSWTDGQCGAADPYCHKIDIISCLTDYSIMTTP